LRAVGPGIARKAKIDTGGWKDSTASEYFKEKRKMMVKRRGGAPKT